MDVVESSRVGSMIWTVLPCHLLLLLCPTSVEGYTLDANGLEECEMMAVASDMGREAAQEVMDLFLSQAPEKKDQIATTNTVKVSTLLGEKFGGFWDVFIMGPRFSYSVYCRNYVQLSTSRIEVLICKESDVGFDSSGGGVDCHTPGFEISANDTISSSTEVITLPHFQQMRVTLKDGLDSSSFNKLGSLISSADFSKPVADALRKSAEEELGGGMWNIIVEEEKSANVQGFYYDYRRQLGFETLDKRWVIFAFDRRCRR
mmetsp:Transcript_47087/g.75655  ORF Transcript_47087/g.75655 Transcript_47087/m.75655 type:complete len:260 (+) Transcript_47087:41-820(+)